MLSDFQLIALKDRVSPLLNNYDITRGLEPFVLSFDLQQYFPARKKQAGVGDITPNIQMGPHYN